MYNQSSVSQSLVARQAREAGFQVDVIESFEGCAGSSVERHRGAGVARPAEVTAQSGHCTVRRLKRTNERHVRCNTLDDLQVDSVHSSLRKTTGRHLPYGIIYLPPDKDERAPP